MILEEEDGYSQRGYSRSADWEARGRFGGGNSYDDGTLPFGKTRQLAKTISDIRETDHVITV